MRFYFLLLLFLSGCATRLPESSRPRIAPRDATAGTIYLVRDRPRIEAAVYANGRKLAALSDKNVLRTEPIYTWVSIPPGKYRIGVFPLDYEWHGEAAAESELNIEGGKNYFIRVEWPPKPEPSFVAAITQPLIEPIVGRKHYAAPGLIMIPEKEGFEVIKNCRFVESTE